MKENSFLHTLESCWLCLKYPFLYPRSRFTGRHRVNALHRQLHALYVKSTLPITITGKLEVGENKFPYEIRQSNIMFFDNYVYLDKEKKALVFRNSVEKKEHSLRRLVSDNLEIIGISLHFAFSGYPQIFVHVKPKDSADKTNYGFHFEKVEMTISKWQSLKYKVVRWLDEEILDRLLFVPTYTELDSMEPGWRKAFGLKLCDELKKQLNKEGNLYKYRILQIKEKFGRLEWYDEISSKEVLDIIEKYGRMSEEICIVCGEPATKISGGWICPYCDSHFPENRFVHREKVDGKWVVVDEEV